MWSKIRTTLSPPPLEKVFYFGPCWATLLLRQQTLFNSVPYAVHETVGKGVELFSLGGGGGIDGGSGKGLVRRGGGGL